MWIDKVRGGLDLTMIKIFLVKPLCQSNPPHLWWEFKTNTLFLLYLSSSESYSHLRCECLSFSTLCFATGLSYGQGRWQFLVFLLFAFFPLCLLFLGESPAQFSFPYQPTLQALFVLPLFVPIISPSWPQNPDHPFLPSHSILFSLPSSTIGYVIFPQILTSIRLPFTTICRVSTGGYVQLWFGCSHHHPCWRYHSWDLYSHELPLFLGVDRFGGVWKMVWAFSSSSVGFRMVRWQALVLGVGFSLTCGILTAGGEATLAVFA